MWLRPHSSTSHREMTEAHFTETTHSTDRHLRLVFNYKPYITSKVRQVASLLSWQCNKVCREITPLPTHTLYIFLFRAVTERPQLVVVAHSGKKGMVQPFCATLCNVRYYVRPDMRHLTPSVEARTHARTHTHTVCREAAHRSKTFVSGCLPQSSAPNLRGSPDLWFSSRSWQAASTGSRCR